MKRLSNKSRQLWPALALAFLALMAGVALGGSSVRSWLVSGQASGASTAQHKAEASAKKKAKRGPRGPRGKRGPKGKTGAQGATGAQGVAGPQGAPGVSGDQVYDFSINWQNQSADPGAGSTTSAVAIPGVGTLNLSCPWPYEEASQSGVMTFTPSTGAGTRGVASYTVTQGAGTEGKSMVTRAESTGAPIPIGYEKNGRVALPVNGMVTGTLSIEPFSGNGGASQPPATFTLSSYYVVNDPVNANRQCHISGQVISRLP